MQENTQENIQLIPVYSHYIRIDERRRIMSGFSTAFEEPKEDDILLREDAGRQFRLTEDGEENPPLYTARGVPLYQYKDDEVGERPKDDVQADEDALPVPEPTPGYVVFVQGLMEGYDG